MEVEARQEPLKPSDVDATVSWFDAFASRVAEYVSRAWFFTACVLLVVIWAPLFRAFPDTNTWQLALNTPTTAITFLLVALIQNTTTRADHALQRKTNANAAALLYLIEMQENGRDEARELELVRELKAAQGLEVRESA